MSEENLTEQIMEHLEVVLQKRPGDLGAAIRQLDAVRARATGHLSHYLAKRSYQKAWILLNGGDPEKGVCG